MSIPASSLSRRPATHRNQVDHRQQNSRWQNSRCLLKGVSGLKTYSSWGPLQIALRACIARTAACSRPWTKMFGGPLLFHVNVCADGPLLALLQLDLSPGECAGGGPPASHACHSRMCLPWQPIRTNAGEKQHGK